MLGFYVYIPSFFWKWNGVVVERKAGLLTDWLTTARASRYLEPLESGWLANERAKFWPFLRYGLVLMVPRLELWSWIVLEPCVLGLVLFVPSSQMDGEGHVMIGLNDRTID